MKTCYTVIIGPYDDLKQPFIISQHWRYVCFTDQDFELPDDNKWEIVKVDIDPNLSAAKNARKIKILFHEYITTEFSLFIDGTFFINCDLNRWWKRFKAPMTCIDHPIDDCIYTDIRSCLGGGKGDFWKLVEQASDYKKLGIPEHNGLISSGILMRQRCEGTIQLCQTWWEQVEKYSERDQVAFGYAAWKHPGIFDTIEWNYQSPDVSEFLHCPHLHKASRVTRYKEIGKKHGRW